MKTYLSVQIVKISPSTFVKHVVAPQDDFGTEMIFVTSITSTASVKVFPLAKIPYSIEHFLWIFSD